MLTNGVRSLMMTSSIIAAIAIAISPAAAQVAKPQEAVQELDEADSTESAGTGDPEIVVTGTRISRPDLTSASPVSVIDRDEIDFRQATNAEELLRDLPAVRPANGPSNNNTADGRAEIDLRGLNFDTNRTLILLDGQRLVPSDLAAITDTDVIPLALISRVDVVTGGASTVYGADAVAGVVNFITRRDFSGLEVSASYRIAEGGDAGQKRVDLTWGANVDGGRGNVVLGVGYQKRDPLGMRERDFARFRLDTATGLFQGDTFTAPGILVSPNIPDAPNAGFGTILDPATGRFRTTTVSDLYNFNEAQLLITGMERYNIYGSARYEVTPGIELYGSAFFNSKRFLVQGSPPPLTNPVRVGLNNPFLPVPARNQLCAGSDSNPAVPGVQPFSPEACAAAAAVVGGPGTPGYVEIPIIFNRRFVEEGPRIIRRDIDIWQVQVGARGSITDTLSYDISAQHGNGEHLHTNENFGSVSALQQAVRSFRNASGQIVCADTSNACVPLNLFGDRGSVTPDMLKLFDVGGFIRRKVSLSVVTGSVFGDLFGIRSPFAEKPAAFAAGVEYRKFAGSIFVDNATQRGDILAAGPLDPTRGSVTAKEVFGELIVPLVQNSFVYGITLEGGIRYSDYSTTGGSTTWKAGGSIEPVQGIKFRGMYQKAVRSPNLLELFQTPLRASNNIQIDPCGGPNPAAARSLCEATGAPAGTYGSIPHPTGGVANVIVGGNPDLEPENARTKTVGLVLTPSFLPGFSATIDYFDILITDAVGTAAAADILDACYSPTLNPSQTASNQFCPLIQRNPVTGGLFGGLETPGVFLVNSNLGRAATAGVDVGATYRLNLGDLGAGPDGGVLNFGVNGTWLRYLHHQFSRFGVNRDCTGVFSPRCTNPRPTWKWNARATYTLGGLDLSLMWSHMSAVVIEPFQAQPTLPLSTPQFGGPDPRFVLDEFERIPAYDYFDLAARYRVGDHLTLNLTVDNLFDKQPPVLGSGVGGGRSNVANTFPNVYDPLGRTFTIGAVLRF